MKLKTFFILFLACQTASALNYTNLPDLNLTIGIPPYQIVWDYNLAQSQAIDGPPQGVTASNGTGYQDAWIKILALNQTVYDSGTASFSASYQGKVLTKYDYTPRCPSSDYCWSSCTGKRYELIDSTGALRVYANNQLLDTTTITAYSVPETSTQLNVRAELGIETRCMKYHLEGRIDPDTGDLYCVEIQDDIETFFGNLADQSLYSIKGLNPQANLTFTHIAKDITEISTGKLIITTDTPYTSLNLSLGNGSLTFYASGYDVSYYLPDYNLLRISVYSLPRITKYALFSNISETKDQNTGGTVTELDFALSYPETEEMLKTRDCKLVLQDTFYKEYSLDNLCQTEWKQTEINASTNGKIYANNKDITVYVLLTYNGSPLPDKQILIKYAGIEYTKNTGSDGKTDFTLVAKYPLQ